MSSRCSARRQPAGVGAFHVVGDDDQLEIRVDQFLQEGVVPRLILELGRLVGRGVALLAPVVTLYRVDVEGGRAKTCRLLELRADGSLEGVEGSVRHRDGPDREESEPPTGGSK
jgi:hypothetical protein